VKTDLKWTWKMNKGFVFRCEDVVLVLVKTFILTFRLFYIREKNTK